MSSISDDDLEPDADKWVTLPKDDLERLEVDIVWLTGELRHCVEMLEDARKELTRLAELRRPTP